MSIPSVAAFWRIVSPNTNWLFFRVRNASSPPLKPPFPSRMACVLPALAKTYSAKRGPPRLKNARGCKTRVSASLLVLSLPALPTADPLILPQLTWADLARQANYRPQKVAALCCVSFRTIQRHFRKHYQKTFTCWLEQHRMGEAHRRVLHGDSLKEICFDLGYKQQSHFTRVFKKHFGIPPSILSPGADHFPSTPAEPLP